MRRRASPGEGGRSGHAAVRPRRASGLEHRAHSGGRGLSPEPSRPRRRGARSPRVRGVAPRDPGGWLRSERGTTLTPLAQAALALARIVEILPFEDGNGRASRLAASHLMVAGGCAPAHPRGRRRSASSSDARGRFPLRDGAARAAARRGIGTRARRDDPDAGALMSGLELPPALAPLVSALREAGGRPYIVGGAVRDALLGLPVKDYDVEVYGLPAEELRAVLEGLGRVDARGGESFRCTSSAGSRESRERVDVSLPRRDSKVGPGHRGIAVGGRSWPLDRGSLPPPRLHDQRPPVRSRQGALLDPHGGRTDLEARAASARWTRGRSARTPCAPCAPCSSPPGSTLTVDPQTAGSARRCRSPSFPRSASSGRSRSCC